MSLGHFESDGSGADDDEMRQEAGGIKDRFIGEERDRVNARNGRHRRRRARRYHKAAGPDLIAAGDYGRAVLEGGLRQNDLDAEAGKTLDGVIRFDGGDDLVDMGEHSAVVDLRVDRANAEWRSGPHGLSPLAGGEERLGGDTAIIQTVAAHLMALDQHDIGAEAGRSGRNRQPA